MSESRPSALMAPSSVGERLGGDTHTSSTAVANRFSVFPIINLFIYQAILRGFTFLSLNDPPSRKDVRERECAREREGDEFVEQKC